MNRRESALSSERIKAMAEGKGTKSRRPAEETFFESFPKDFDAFEEPAARTASKQRTGGPRPAPRPGGRQAARPAQRGNKQPAMPRGRRDSDEWGQADDYDDEYWNRVRSDDGGFGGGTIAARMAAPRPVTPAADSTAGGVPDPDAVTVQAPLPKRPVPAAATGLAEPVEALRAPSASLMAEQKTMAFSAPTPETLSAVSPEAAITTNPAVRLDPLSPTTGPYPAKPAKPVDPVQAFQTDPFFAPRGTGPFEAPRATGSTSGSFPAAPGAGLFETTRPAASSSPSTGPYDSPRTSGSFDRVRSTGPFEATPSPASAADDPFSGPSTGMFEAVRGSGPLDSPRPADPVDLGPSSGPSTGMFEAVRGTGPFASPSAAPSSPSSFETTGSYATTGSFETRPAYRQPRKDGYDGGLGEPFSADTGPSYTVPATGGEAASYPPPATAPGWPGVRDVLDDPEPPRGTSSWPAWPSGENHRTTAGHDEGYGSYSPEKTYPSGVPSPSPSSYEVSAGWATIDDADTVTGPNPAMGIPTSPSPAVSPYERTGYDSGAGRPATGPNYYDYERTGYNAAEQPVQPAQNSGAKWPTYNELYGTSSESSTNQGNNRNPETDYPDYYR
jgi:hypothetical protein